MQVPRVMVTAVRHKPLAPQEEGPICDISPDGRSLKQGWGFWRDPVSASPIPLDVTLLSLWRNCSASFEVLFGGNCSICSCMFSVPVGGCEFRIFLCHQLGPPQPPSEFFTVTFLQQVKTVFPFCCLNKKWFSS